jgi:hypothetical protein
VLSGANIEVEGERDTMRDTRLGRFGRCSSGGHSGGDLDPESGRVGSETKKQVSLSDARDGLGLRAMADAAEAVGRGRSMQEVRSVCNISWGFPHRGGQLMESG